MRFLCSLAICWPFWRSSSGKGFSSEMSLMLLVVVVVQKSLNGASEAIDTNLNLLKAFSGAVSTEWRCLA